MEQSVNVQKQIPKYQQVDFKKLVDDIKWILST